MIARRVVAAVGRGFIATGVLLLLFVAYQLWGTGIATAREQRSLKADLVRQLGFDPSDTDPSVTTTVPAPTAVPDVSTTAVSANAPSTTEAVGGPRPTSGPVAPTTTAFRSKRPPVPVSPGDAVGYLKIPRINVGWAFVEGTSTEALKKGPGHYPGTPQPGQPGNAAIAGHRTTYGAPFYRLEELKVGDPIFVVTRQGRFHYAVTSSKVVRPTDVAVLNPVPGHNLLTLTTCHPRFSAAKRLIITAELVGEAALADVEPTPTTTVPVGPPETGPPVTDGTDGPVVSTVPAAPTTTVAPDPAGGSLGEAEHRGSWRLGSWLAGNPGVWGQTFAWALVCAVIWLGAWAAARRQRRTFAGLGVYLVLALPFLLALYFCYENLARLLPANV